MERNLCRDSGCLGFCCQDINLEVTKFERKRVFSTAIKVDTFKILDEIKGLKIPGVYYTRCRRKRLGDSGFELITIVGSCPNKAKDGSCQKHAEREHAARNFDIGSEICNAIRKEHGLSPIFIEPVE